MKRSKLPFEVDHKAVAPGEIQSQQNRQIEEVAMILGQTPESAAILLRHYRWNKERLIESYMDNPDKVLENAGLGNRRPTTPRTVAVSGFVCEICFEDEDGLQTYAMECGHRYCAECYTRYLTQKIKDEGEAARIQCPRQGCNRVIDSKTIDLLLSEELSERFALWNGLGYGKLG